jgi:hypothetical protein
MFTIKKLKLKIKLRIKRLWLKIIINKRIALCRWVKGEKYLWCLNCRQLQRCHRRFLGREVKWVL